MDIKYFVRTTGERKFNYDLDYTLLVDTEHKPVDSFIKQLGEISEYDAVLMEDDLILCKDFKNEIEKVISQHPTTIIQFFTQPKEYFTSHMRSHPFTWNQCTYYPKGIGKRLARAMESARRLHNFPKNLWSVVENTALQELNIPFYAYRPCLVQHNDIKSLINSPGCDVRRDTIYFKDYLDEAGIKYEDAYTPENVTKLYYIRTAHVKQIEQEFLINQAIDKLDKEGDV